MDARTLVGKKVRITKQGMGIPAGYIGQIGTVVEKDIHESHIAVDVIMEDGQKICPYIPGRSDAECELVEDYSYSVLKGKKYAVHVTTMEEWNKVTEICGYKWSKHHSTLPYREKTCIGLGEIGYGTKDIAYPNHTIISAKEFLDANQPTTTDKEEDVWYVRCNEEYGNLKPGQEVQLVNYKRDQSGEYWNYYMPGGSDDTGSGYKRRYSEPYKKNTMNKTQEQRIADLEATIEQAKREIEELKYLPIGTIVKWNGSNPVIGKIIGRKDDFYQLDVKGCTTSHDSCYYEHVRKATEAQIAEYNKSKEEIVHIGHGRTPIKISKGKIVGPESKNIDIERVRNIVKRMNGDRDISGWAIKFHKVDIGCCHEITIAELEEVIQVYEKLTNQ